MLPWGQQGRGINYTGDRRAHRTRGELSSQSKGGQRHNLTQRKCSQHKVRSTVTSWAGMRPISKEVEGLRAETQPRHAERPTERRGGREGSILGPANSLHTRPWPQCGKRTRGASSHKTTTQGPTCEAQGEAVVAGTAAVRAGQRPERESAGRSRRRQVRARSCWQQVDPSLPPWVMEHHSLSLPGDLTEKERLTLQMSIEVGYWCSHKDLCKFYFLESKCTTVDLLFISHSFSAYQSISYIFVFLDN